MNSVTASQKGGSRGLENDAIVLRAEIERMELKLDTEKRLRKIDRDMFAKKEAEYRKTAEKNEAEVAEMKRTVQDFGEMKLELTVRADLLKEQSAALELSKKAVKDCQADITKERQKVKNLEDTVQSMQLTSAKREADLLERESELAKLKVEYANLSEKSTQQECEMSHLKANNADLLDKAGQRELQVAELKAENANLSKTSADLASELAKLKNFMAALSAQTAALSSSTQSSDVRVCPDADGKSGPAEATGAKNDGVHMQVADITSSMAASENAATLQSKSDARVEESSKSDKEISDVSADPQLEGAPSCATVTTQTKESKISSDASTNQDAVADAPLPASAESNASILALLDKCEISAAEKQRATAGSSGVVTLTSGVPKNGDADSMHDTNLPPNAQEECNAEMNALSLGSNHTTIAWQQAHFRLATITQSEMKSPAGDEKEKNDNEIDECKSTAALCGRDSKSECARSSNAGSAGGCESSSIRKGSISSSDSNRTIAVESDDSKRKQRKRKSHSLKKSFSSSKRHRSDTTTTPPAKSSLNRKEGLGSTSSANKKSKPSKSGSSVSGSDKRESRSKGKGDQIGRARSREAEQRKNPPVDQRRASQMSANRRPPWVGPLASSDRRQQFLQPIPFRGGGHQVRGSNGNGSFNQQQRHTHRGAWQQGRHYPAKPENGRDAGPNRNQNR